MSEPDTMPDPVYMGEPKPGIAPEVAIEADGADWLLLGAALVITGALVAATVWDGVGGAMLGVPVGAADVMAGGCCVGLTLVAIGAGALVASVVVAMGAFFRPDAGSLSLSPPQPNRPLLEPTPRARVTVMPRLELNTRVRIFTPQRVFARAHRASPLMNISKRLCSS
jgi:hypothetical protein